MSEQELNKDIKDRFIRIALTDGLEINGRVNINRNAGFDRVSDLIASEHEQFLILMNATVYKANLDKPIKHETMFVNKKYILWALPDYNG